MNTFKKLIVVSALSTGFVFSSQAVELKAADNSTYTQLCLTAVSSSRPAMYNAIKASGYSKNFIAKNLRCNADDLISFVQSYGKNADDMIRAIQNRGTHVSISDIAMLKREYMK
ncbi:hypothetical protein tinsulaeT_10470 [Thalassotalea insulae]|uniref:DUF3718 domain-containing protein n=1 Tax=Thalassotalea insulae TaxID=2056778 RepID=A0ABQ6GQM0_9GAMM|nr:DUF3718 domain-containing protein [Thalassotalea insulae]GLX77707.1 hypothetical protein tinsulaeT_10470 [Thalassotalea insulae]